ncbi:MAG: hypothetical protein IAE79_19985 [Anaerolinea sp.]|nr:hypothetical protein [Anaerolinea sp.]
MSSAHPLRGRQASCLKLHLMGSCGEPGANALVLYDGRQGRANVAITNSKRGEENNVSRDYHPSQ